MGCIYCFIQRSNIKLLSQGCQNTSCQQTCTLCGFSAVTMMYFTCWIVLCRASTCPQIFSACHTSTHVDDCALRLHQRWSFHALCVLPLATARFQRLLHRSGTVCRSRSGRLRCSKFSAADWKPNFLPCLTVMTLSLIHISEPTRPY